MSGKYQLDRGLFAASIATQLHVTTALAFKSGRVAAGGVANDTVLVAILIHGGAGPPTATVAGFQDETGTAQSMVFSGNATTDTYIPVGAINDKGALTVTGSVADKVVVLTRPASGP